MVLSDRTPIATWQKAFIVPCLPINIVRKHWDHVFVCLMIKMMDSVALVKNISHHLCWGGIDNGRRYDVSHVAMITVLGYSELRI